MKNYARHLLPTRIGTPNAFLCTLYGYKIERVDCGNCMTPCSCNGITRGVWCVLYTPPICHKCVADCTFSRGEENEREIHSKAI